LFRQEIADLIRSEVSDPRLEALLSLTRVDISPDLENATVYVSILGDAQTKASSMRALTAAAPFLRRHLIARIRIRRIPALRFLLDESIEEAARVLELMKQVSESEPPSEPEGPAGKPGANA